MMCPKRRSTPVAGMEMICHVPPLELFIKGEACKAYIRNMNMLPYEWSGVGKNGTFGHLQANELLCEEFGIPEMEWDRQIAQVSTWTKTP